MTGRAKGLPPFKLLVKYPLRMALNPFIAYIGNLLPQVISGAAIVSLVLLWVGCRARFVWLENLTAGDHQLGARLRRSLPLLRRVLVVQAPQRRQPARLGLLDSWLAPFARTNSSSSLPASLSCC